MVLLRGSLCLKTNLRPPRIVKTSIARMDHESL
jgi:hypothetical protein